MKFNTIDSKEGKSSTRDTLDRSLKHLEFVLFVEMHLEKQKNYCSPRFLKAFKDLKHDAQVNVLKYSSHCKKL